MFFMKYKKLIEIELNSNGLVDLSFFFFFSFFFKWIYFTCVHIISKRKLHFIILNYTPDYILYHKLWYLLYFVPNIKFSVNLDGKI